MKKLIALLLAATLLLLCAACGSKKEEKKDRLAQIKERGYIEVATEPYFAPNEFIDPSKQGDEQYVGFDIEIAKYIAEKLGVELKLVPLEFSAVLSSMTEGKYDMAISALAYSPTRAEAMNLSKGYFFSTNEDPELNGYGFVCRTEDVAKYTDVESLKDAVVATQSASVQENYYQEYVGDKNCKELKLYSSMYDVYLAISEGKADVGIVSKGAADLYAQANGNAISVVRSFMFPQNDEWSGTRIATPLEDTDSLMEVINQCIDELMEKGQIIEWRAYYQEYAKTLGVSD